MKCGDEDCDGNLMELNNGKFLCDNCFCPQEGEETQKEFEDG